MALQNCAIVPMNTFLNNTYHIPNYQREYSWETNELSDFWEDLNTIREDSGDHFFGQIVVHSDLEQQKKYIIDGQQRTITSTIFMRTLQYFYEAIYMDHQIKAAFYKASDISAIHIGRYTDPHDDQLHLHLGELDNDYFRENIQPGNPENAEKKPKKSLDRMRKAYLFFYDKVKKELNHLTNVEDKLALLNKYFVNFTQKFRILYMEATELDEAFVIFETLNARGKELETADLLKNFIFSKGRDIDQAQKQWNSMLNALDKSDPTKFVRHFWNSSRAFAREKDLYREISRGIDSPRASRELLEALANMLSVIMTSYLLKKMWALVTAHSLKVFVRSNY